MVKLEFLTPAAGRRILDSQERCTMKRECPACLGMQELPCLECDGNGVLEWGDKCYLCKGVGYMECHRCVGSGIVDEEKQTIHVTTDT